MSTSIKRELPGRTEWTNKQGQLHREDGPTVEWTNGRKEWWWDGFVHREDGPAIVWADGSKQWWVNYQHIEIY
jgi:hypothetical protein